MKSRRASSKGEGPRSWIRGQLIDKETPVSSAAAGRPQDITPQQYLNSIEKANAALRGAPTRGGSWGGARAGRGGRFSRSGGRGGSTGFEAAPAAAQQQPLQQQPLQQQALQQPLQQQQQQQQRQQQQGGGGHRYRRGGGRGGYAGPSSARGGGFGGRAGDLPPTWKSPTQNL
ncbi:hypothetical protein EAH_00042150 [Eimeria acervulina]|uniref:Uncharacterized protein n=1 Tax=Eimeria acervulina TaxID=5801 RepID=U6GGL8_EIMAC|nr:hypothetical protein EAH_00042150 [Eimeria acervulina]CDI79320.1 hypothetical protein EAH_00042150 [Eimeria acervulina]